MSTATFWTGETKSATYKFGVTAVTVSATAVVAMKIFPQIENPLSIASAGSLLGISWLESGEQQVYQKDPMATRLHRLGLIPIVRGLQVACFATLAAPPLLNPGLWGRGGPLVRMITIYMAYNWTIEPTQKAYKHPAALGNGTCWRAFMGCRGDYMIKGPHTCLLGETSDRGR